MGRGGSAGVDPYLEGWNGRLARRNPWFELISVSADDGLGRYYSWVGSAGDSCPSFFLAHLSCCHDASQYLRQTITSGDAVVRLTGRHSNEAASYDQKHGETLDQLVEEMRAKLDFIGVNWVGEDEDEDGDAPKRRVKILDYACGTGWVSRVGCCL